MPQYIWSDKLTLVQVIVWRRETKKNITRTNVDPDLCRYMRR